MYIVKKSTGSWEDFYVCSEFVTESEEYAKSYCDKANNLLVKLKAFFKQIDDELDSMGISEDEIKDKDRYRFLVGMWNRYREFEDTNRWYYEPIEVRKIKL